MFTGLIEEVGTLKSVTKTSAGAVVTVASKLAKELKIGDSVAVNGVCSTVVKLGSDTFCVEYSNKTLEVTTFSGLKSGEKLNLERPLRLSDRLDGHIVTGHIDGVTKISDIKKDGFSYKYTFKLPSEYKNQVVNKGSIAINGISLTVAECTDDEFVLEIIPHTLEHTNLGVLKAGDFVNFETDITGKYIEKNLCLKDNDVASGRKKQPVDMEFLSEKGFV